jgi:hypothetical protein
MQFVELFLHDVRAVLKWVTFYIIAYSLAKNIVVNEAKYCTACD